MMGYNTLYGQGYSEGYRDGVKAEQERTAAALRARGYSEEEIQAILNLH